MSQYKSVTVSSGIFSSLDSEVDNEATRQGRDGWRVDSVTKDGDTARIQFIKD